MKQKNYSLLLLLTLFTSGLFAQTISLNPIGTYQSGLFDESAAEIAAYEHVTQRLYVTNAFANTVDVLDISDPTNPVLDFTIDLSPYGAGVNSVAIRKGVIAVAVESDPKQNPGKVVFFNRQGQFESYVTVGALPDMITFTPNAKFLVVANEGEPNSDYTVDPMGTVSIISLGANPAKKIKNLKQKHVTTVDFTAFNGMTLDPSIRIFGPGASVAQDLEPEYITISDDSRLAYVVCQENNAIAEINIRKRQVNKLWGLGFKDHSLPGNGLDASNDDDSIRIENWPVNGIYQPDAIAFYSRGGKDYILTANEGDAREYEGTPGYVGEDRIKDVTLDPTVFPNAAALQANSELGRLKLALSEGDIDNDGDYDAIYTYGARSFSVYEVNGNQVYDSGDDFEQITAIEIPDNFNSTNDENGSLDNRSDDKGPEPEGLTLGKVGKRTYAFIGLERVGGIMVYDVTIPTSPSFVTYYNNRDFTADAESDTVGDLGPEGLIFIPIGISPNGEPLLVVTNEVSGTTTIFEISTGMMARKALAQEDLFSGAKLMTNVPNPFTAETEIKFSLSEAANVKVEVYTLMGHKVATLTDQPFKPGEHSLNWQATDDQGGKLAAGVYVTRMVIGNAVLSNKMIYLGE
jgi:2',3'-cyclic-nucleotide 2'-phosphodiesterase/3'-nucleotidase/5'-nucleotidase